MSNNTKNRFGLNSAAANCKKVLKNLKIRTAMVSVSAFALSAVAICAAISAGSDDISLNAVPEKTTRSVMSAIPPKEYDVTISVDGKNISVRTSGTVADAISAADIRMGDDDLINIGFGEPLNSNTEIIINRVDIVEEVQVEVIDYATKYREDDGYMEGYTETVVNGEEGEIETTLRHVYVDGELISSDVIGEDITEPIDEVVVIGTKEEEVYVAPQPEPVEIPDTAVPAAQTPESDEVALDENGVPLDYTLVMQGTACAYTAPSGALTSTGKVAAVGMVAVDPDIIPYGTKLYIAAADGSAVYGYAIAADTGGALVNGSILVDLFMNTESECYAWGRRNVNVYFLN